MKTMNFYHLSSFLLSTEIMACDRHRQSDRQEEVEGDSLVAAETEKKLKKPKLYNVLLHNDNYTTMEFVVQILMNVFHHSQGEAVRIMLQVHHNDVGLAGIYSFEIAETKVAQVTDLARQNEFPLRCSMEAA